MLLLPWECVLLLFLMMPVTEAEVAEPTAAVCEIVVCLALPAALLVILLLLTLLGCTGDAHGRPRVFLRSFLSPGVAHSVLLLGENICWCAGVTLSRIAAGPCSRSWKGALSSTLSLPTAAPV